MKKSELEKMVRSLVQESLLIQEAKTWDYDDLLFKLRPLNTDGAFYQDDSYFLPFVKKADRELFIERAQEVGFMPKDFTKVNMSTMFAKPYLIKFSVK
jgi:hypothetical protein